MATTSTIYYPSATFWQTARKIYGSGRKAFPIPGAPAHFTLEDRLAIKLSHYSRLALDTVHDVESSAYLVDEQVDEKSPAFVYFRRLFATIPASHTERTSGTWSFPGFTASGGLEAGKTITAHNDSTQAFTVAAHGYSNGDTVIYKIRQESLFGRVYNSQGTTTISSVTTDTFILDGVKLNALPFDSGTVLRSSIPVPARDPFTSQVDVALEMDYFLPGVTSGITTVDDITLTQTFRPLDAAGDTTDTLSATTIPTAAEYFAMVTSGEFIPVECDLERYLGNIYRRVTRYVRAL